MGGPIRAETRQRLSEAVWGAFGDARFRRPAAFDGGGAATASFSCAKQSGEPPGEPAHEVLGTGAPALTSALHRRRYPIATDNDDRCLPCAITLLLPAGDEHMRASLQIGLTASDKVDDFGVARDDNGLLAILVFDLQRVPLDFLQLLRDGSWSWCYSASSPTDRTSTAF